MNRKGHTPEEWTAVSMKPVLLQPINTGTLVYNRQQVKGRTHVPRPADEHVVVEGFCEPIFTRNEMDELLRVAAEIAGTPPARTGGTYLLAGLVYCRCDSRMDTVKNHVTTQARRHSILYHRCRRASPTGPATCARYLPRPWSRRSSPNWRSSSSEPPGRPGSAGRRGAVHGRGPAARADLAVVDAEIEARDARDIDNHGSLRSITRLSDIYAVWFDVLFQLNQVPKQRLLMHKLAPALLLSKTGLTRLVDRMEDADLVQREANDRRSTYVSMTELGMATFKRAMPFVQTSIRHHFAQHIADYEVPVVEAVLTRIARAAREQGAFVVPTKKGQRAQMSSRK